jgi:hypothetical protein
VVGERLARIINRMTLSCCCCCCCNDTAVISSSAGDADEDDDENAVANRRTTRIGAYRQYSDVTLALQPMSSSYRSGGSNGHVIHQQQQTAEMNQQPLNHIKNDRHSCIASDTTQVPLLVCAGLLAIFVGFASFLLVLFEPQLGFFGSLHLTINLLMTLGFAGNLLPGMSAETIMSGESTAANAAGHHQQQQQSRHHHQQSGSIGSQMSLIIVACLILVGTTLLSSSFSILMDNISGGGGHHHQHHSNSSRSSVSQAGGGGSSRRLANHHSSTCYQHMPSPPIAAGRQ